NHHCYKTNESCGNSKQMQAPLNFALFLNCVDKERSVANPLSRLIGIVQFFENLIRSISNQSETFFARSPFDVLGLHFTQIGKFLIEKLLFLLFRPIRVLCLDLSNYLFL